MHLPTILFLVILQLIFEIGLLLTYTNTKKDIISNGRLIVYGAVFAIDIVLFILFVNYLN